MRRRGKPPKQKNITTYNLARMNMLLHGVKDTEFDIFHGDTLLNEWDPGNEECGMTNGLNFAFRLNGFHFLKDEGVMKWGGRLQPSDNSFSEQSGVAQSLPERLLALPQAVAFADVHPQRHEFEVGDDE